MRNVLKYSYKKRKKIDIHILKKNINIMNAIDFLKRQERAEI